MEENNNSDSSSEDNGSDFDFSMKKKIEKSNLTRDINSDDDYYSDSEYVLSASEGAGPDKDKRKEYKAALTTKKKGPPLLTDNVIYEPHIDEGFTKANNKKDIPWKIQKVCISILFHVLQKF